MVFIWFLLSLKKKWKKYDLLFLFFIFFNLCRRCMKETNLLQIISTAWFAYFQYTLFCVIIIIPIIGYISIDPLPSLFCWFDCNQICLVDPIEKGHSKFLKSTICQKCCLFSLIFSVSIKKQKYTNFDKLKIECLHAMRAITIHSKTIFFPS